MLNKEQRLKCTSLRRGTTKQSAEESLILYYLYPADGFRFARLKARRKLSPRRPTSTSPKHKPMEYGGCAYILTNFQHTVKYTGVTADLPKRIYQHKAKEFKNSFTAKYNCDILVWYEWFSRIEDAIAREKQIKAGSRKKKEDLVHTMNPHWKDLWEEVKKW